jgi:hypothetical protein
LRKKSSELQPDDYRPVSILLRLQRWRRISHATLQSK